MLVCKVATIEKPAYLMYAPRTREVVISELMRVQNGDFIPHYLPYRNKIVEDDFAINIDNQEYLIRSETILGMITMYKVMEENDYDY